jgi:hypothetical protein
MSGVLDGDNSAQVIREGIFKVSHLGLKNQENVGRWRELDRGRVFLKACETVFVPMHTFR